MIGRMIEVPLSDCSDVERLRAEVDRLWSLLDDIDTSSDSYRPPQTAWYRCVMAKVAKRHEGVRSDGENLSVAYYCCGECGDTGLVEHPTEDGYWTWCRDCAKGRQILKAQEGSKTS